MFLPGRSLQSPGRAVQGVPVGHPEDAGAVETHRREATRHVPLEQQEAKLGRAVQGARQVWPD